MQAYGRTPAVTLYGADSLAFALLAAGFDVYLRPWIGDGPVQSFPAVDSARVRVDDALYAIGNTPYTCLVLSNEVVFVSTEYAATWIREAIRYSAERGITCLAPVVWPPGHPPLEDVPQLADAYANAPDTIMVLWAFNAYPVEQGRDLSAHGGISEYTVWRYRLYRHQLPEGVGLLITEAARSDGSEPPDFSDIGRFTDEIDGDVTAVTYWYLAGPSGLGHWPDAVLWGRLGELANSVR